MAALPVYDTNLDYDEDAASALSFLNQFKDATGRSKYIELIQSVIQFASDKILVELDDLAHFAHDAESVDPSDTSLSRLLHNIEQNATRYVSIFSDAIDLIVADLEESGVSSFPEHGTSPDVQDYIQIQRREQNRRNAQADQAQFPPELLRRYTLYFKNLSDAPALAVRNIRGHHMGHLLTVRGLVTRVTDVKPLVLVSAYTCDTCGAEIYQEASGKSVTPLTQCVSDMCRENHVKGQLHLQTRASKFAPFQEIKIQELTDQVPIGNTPRSLTVHVHGPIVRSATPGDLVDISGILLPRPYDGFYAMKLGLLTEGILYAHDIFQLKESFDLVSIPDPNYLKSAAQHPLFYDKLARSVAPEIFGHIDVKKALLLLLTAGVSVPMDSGIRNRGDINICLMGDPGVAKSQLLKYIAKISPRGVYTTGRGSSGVGLTAAVMRDPVTDDVILEGGALVIADKGVACIDEFDKMDDSDRTAIHEVMEQQTISISKAGITTTLNARTSVLAAANPIYGRYNPRRSPLENINLPPALLSRFDLMFLLLDTPTPENDRLLASHICRVHMDGSVAQAQTDIFDPMEIRHFIALARRYKPSLTDEAAVKLEQIYVDMRDAQTEAHDENNPASSFLTEHITTRTLLALVRLSTAHARLHFRSKVHVADVLEAHRLMNVSKESILGSYTHANRTRLDDLESTNTRLTRFVLNFARRANGLNATDALQGCSVALSDLRSAVVTDSYTDGDFSSCLENLLEMGIIVRHGPNTLVFV